MKVLLITGTLAEETVKQYAKQSSTPTEVKVINVQIAAFLTPQIISHALTRTPPKNIEIILTPGQMTGDTITISETVGIPAFKGPRYAADLPVILDCLDEVQLSTTKPACDFLRKKLQEKALLELGKVEQNQVDLLKLPGNLRIGNLAVGKEFPMRVLAEIVDAPLLETAEIQRLAKRYAAMGANMIDIGMVAGQSRPQDAERTVIAAKSAVKLPISVDTLNPLEIEAAVKAGADMILSADAGNLKAIAPFAKDTPIVVIPTNQKRGIFSHEPSKRVKMLERLIRQAKQLGFTKIIGDLILEPTHILDSYMAFREFNRINPDVPLLIGIANVVELFDADSVGLNALLARLASEVEANILLTTEKTSKTRGSIGEVAVASKMMFLAKKRDSVPRDLGLDLLILKDRVEKEITYNVDGVKVVQAKRLSKPVAIDPQGVFRIMLDQDSNSIVALHYPSQEAKKPSVEIKGSNSETVMAEILKQKLVSGLDHAAYLGAELAKAEIALRTGKGYVQDEVLFKRK